MSVNYLKVDTNNLKNDAAEIRSLTDNAVNNLKKMYDRMSELDAMWDGLANQAFMAQFQADYQSFTDICSEINRLCEDMSAASGKYNSCENQVYATVASINI